jgi:hypothetical protein
LLLGTSANLRPCYSNTSDNIEGPKVELAFVSRFGLRGPKASGKLNHRHLEESLSSPGRVIQGTGRVIFLGNSVRGLLRAGVRSLAGGKKDRNHNGQQTKLYQHAIEGQEDDQIVAPIATKNVLLRMHGEQPLERHKHKKSDKNYLEAKRNPSTPRWPSPYRYLPMA